jgi:hypothetical protein
VTDTPPQKEDNPKPEYLAFDRPMSAEEWAELEGRLKESLLVKWLDGEFLPQEPPPAAKMLDAPVEFHHSHTPHDIAEFKRRIAGEAAMLPTSMGGYLIPKDSPLNDIEYVKGLSEKEFQSLLQEHYVYPRPYGYWGDSYLNYPIGQDSRVQSYIAIAIAFIVGLALVVFLIASRL